jgi:hypothetical protein
MKAQRVFLDALLDDAGLFPPAELTIAQTIARHEATEAEPDSWMLGRVVVPSTKLAEFAAAGPGDWGISAVIDAPLVHDGFSAARDAAAAGLRIESIEIPLARGKGADASSRLDDLCTQLTGAGLGKLELFVEMPLEKRDEIAYHLCAIREAGRDHALRLLAKVRCGGRTVPPASLLACFLAEAAENHLAFKATAGLHQPLAHGGDAAREHGFVNLFAAAVLVHAGAIDETDATGLLGVDRPGAIRFDEAGLHWGACSAAMPAIIEARERFARSFGTCSLAEPIDGLRELGVLEPAAV